MVDSLPSEGASAIGAEDEEDVLGRVESLVEDGFVVKLSRPKSPFDRELDVAFVVGLRGKECKISSALVR